MPSPYADLATRFLDGAIVAGSPAVSPDGSLVAFTTSRVDLEANKYRRQVWLLPADGSAPARAVTAGDPGEGQPVWSPDGRAIAFVSSRAKGDKAEGKATLHLLPLGGGEVVTVATLPDGIEDLSWSPDGQWLAFCSRTRDERYEAEDESWQAPRRIETFLTQLDGEGWVFDRPSQVYVVAADGGRPRNLTPGPYEHHGTAWLADSSGLVTSAARHDGWDRDLATDLYLVPLDGEPRALTERTGTYGSPSVSPDGRHVAFLGDDEPLVYPQNTKVGVIELASGARRWISEDLDRTFATSWAAPPPVWVDDATLLAPAEDRGRAHIYRLTLDATPPEPVTAGDRVAVAVGAAGGTMAVSVASVDRPFEIEVRREGASVTACTAMAARWRATARLQGWDRFTVPTTDGSDEIDVWMMRPPDLDPGRRHPVLLNVHGGPFAEYGEVCFDEFQIQAAAGFVVVACNPRGASGRHTAWGQAIMGPKHPLRPGSGWGSVDVDDVLAALDGALAREPACDPERVGMLGGSYGGYMATWLAAKHGSRFKAICSERSVNDLLTEEWSSDIATLFRVEHGPDPVEDPEEYLRMSPITFAKDISVPMLIIHSEDDLRCPIGQADELFVTLRLLGKDVVFYRFPGEGHELSRSGSPVHRRQRFEIILDYFAEHLHP